MSASDTNAGLEAVNEKFHLGETQKEVSRLKNLFLDSSSLRQFYQVNPDTLSQADAETLYPLLFRQDKYTHLRSRGKGLFILSDCP